MPQSAYDIIPDLHGDYDRLLRTLEMLGYTHRDGAWRAPWGRKAAFLGDFIDSGPQNAAVISTVRSMIDADQAVAIMGNHEMNAVHFHTQGRDWLQSDGGFMRAHDVRNTRQHQSFLQEFPLGSPQAADAIAFFRTLPVCLDLGALRIGHASWSESGVTAIRAKRPDGILAEEDYQALALEEDDQFTQAVLNIVKGPEVRLPHDMSFTDHKGDARHNIRVSWWIPEAVTWREVAASVPDPDQLPDGVCDAAGLTIDPGTVPVAFGHYKRQGDVCIDAPLALCLDYPKVLPAYRWDGEAAFQADKIITEQHIEHAPTIT